ARTDRSRDTLGSVLDLRALREDPERARASQRARGERPDAIDELLESDERRRSVQTEFEAMRAEQKSLSKEIPRASAEDKPALLERTKALSAKVKDVEASANEARAEFDRLAQIPSNVIEPGV